MATVSARRPVNPAIGIMTLVQGGIFIALGLSVALASSYMSDMRFVFGPIDESIFHELRVMLGDAVVILGISSVAIGIVTLHRKKMMWLSQVITTGLAVAVLLAIYDIMYQPFYFLLAPLAVSAILVASLLRLRRSS